jgi:uncharacterized protein (TIGR03437 family)
MSMKLYARASVHKNMLRRVSLCLFLLILPLSRSRAQCSAAPPANSTVDFPTMCNELQSHLDSFQASLPSSITKSNVAFSAQLLSANENQPLQSILSPSALSRVQAELTALANVGVQAVTIQVGFPILYQPFYSFQNNNSADYAQVLSFYQNVMSEARKRGFKVVIECTPMFPTNATDLPLSAYYASLNPTPPSAAVIAGRAQSALVAAQTLKPDWLNLGSEPDTYSALLGITSTPYTPQTYSNEIKQIVAMLRANGINGSPLVGAGVGTWDADAGDYITDEAGTGIDFIDFHVYSVNTVGSSNFLANAITDIDQAHAAGIQHAAISECWMKKVSDGQLAGKTDLGIEEEFSNNTTGSYDTFSFWAPLDAQFLTELGGLANWKSLYYISPFPIEFFFAYEAYTSSLSVDQILSQENTLASLAMQQGMLSTTGQSYKALAAGTSSGPATVSAASGTAPVAPGSIVSIYGTNFGGNGAVATMQPLPTSLGGVTVTLTDSSGAPIAMPLFYAGNTQINAQVPASAATGAATVTVSSSAGSQTGSVTLATVAPGIFTANETGSGVAAAQVATNANGSQTVTNVFQCTNGPGSCVGTPIDLNTGSSALVLYGTGIRNRASLSDVTVSIGTQVLPAVFAGPAPGYVGLDQVNVNLPASLAGSGTVNVIVKIAGTVSNTVTVTFK